MELKIFFIIFEELFEWQKLNKVIMNFKQATIKLYILVMSHTRFRVNPHSIVA